MLTLYRKEEQKGFLPSLLDRPSLDFSQPGEKEHLVFQERIWGQKNGEEFIFNPMQYGVNKFFDDMSFDLPLMSDTVINYYSSGRREVVPAEFPYLLGVGFSFCNKKHTFSDGLKIVNMEKMLTMFRRDKTLQALDEKYPYLRSNGRFSLNVKTGEFNLEMPLAYGVCVSGSVSDVTENCAPSSLSNLQRFFATYANVLRNGLPGNTQSNYEAIETWMRKKGIKAEAGRNNKAFCRLMVGYRNLSYSEVERALLRRKKDLSELREVYVKYGEPLQLSYGLHVYAQSHTNKYSDFDSNIGCPTKGDFIFPPEVFINWGAEFSPAELSIISRERYFMYINPDMSPVSQERIIKSVKMKKKVETNFLKFKKLW